METVLESDGEEQVSVGGAQEEGEEEQVCASAPPEPQPDQGADGSHPESYRVNFPSETRLLVIADSFQRQFSHLYPNRKPLLLCPANECGVKKFVSTTLRPTPAVNPELFTWDSCASFVANFLSLEPLDPPVELPRFLLSPTAVLRSQRASCFEFSTLLCSLLLGAHYDAYCVSGYAVREMCLQDQSLQDCPLLETGTPEPDPHPVKPSRELRRRFLEQEEKKNRDPDAALLQTQNLQEEQRPDDPLRGLRLHCWVLVLSGSRGVQDNFFIDALTGSRYGTDHHSFLGIESVWNHLNYYVNMQDCSNGCSDMVFDLEDLHLWEPVLYGGTSKKKLIDITRRRKEMKSQTSSDEQGWGRGALEMPGSWVGPITICQRDLERRWPSGQRATRYRHAQLERFAAHLRPDGLVTRLTYYRDPYWSEVIMVREWYQHRSDHLEERRISEVDRYTKEHFSRGSRLNLLTLRRTDTDIVMEFSGVRADAPVRRIDSPGEMTEIFEGRSDFLCYRRAVYNQGAQGSKSQRGPLQKVVERFHRNRSKPAHQDVAERVFLLAERRIELTYHLEEGRFIPAKKSFIKPRGWTETEKGGDFTRDMVSSFQVDLSEGPPHTLTLYGMLLDLMKEEEQLVLQITQSEMEIRDILACRENEEAHMELQVSPWTTAGAARARHQREEMDRHTAEEQNWLQEKKEDILAPFLIRIHNSGSLSATHARRLHRDCLDEFEARLLEHRRLLEERYEKELQTYQENQLDMTEEQEEENLTSCSEKTLQIRVIRTRIRRHQQEAPQLLHDLDEKLRGDPRLAPHQLHEAPPPSIAQGAAGQQ